MLTFGITALMFSLGGGLCILGSTLTLDVLLSVNCLEDLLIYVALGDLLSSPVGLIGLFSVISGRDLSNAFYF